MLLRGGLIALTAVTTVYFDIGAEVGVYAISDMYTANIAIF